MTKQELEQIVSLKNEIRLIDQEIKDLESRVVVDTVTGSRTYIPYDKHQIVIKGADVGSTIKLRAKLILKSEELQDLLYDLESWVEQIDDPDMRCIFRLYYRKGLTQEEIGAELGYERSTISRKIQEYLDNSS